MSILNIIKIGGNIIDKPESLACFLAAFSRLEGNKILVHGGGKIASEIGRQMGIESNYEKGRRITDAATLRLVTMVYGGLINKNIVAQLQQSNCNAIGLSGVDGGIIKGTKRAVNEIDFGFVGDVATTEINTQVLNGLLQMGLTPVIAPLSFAAGSLLNTNADTIANELAKALSASHSVNLVYCFEQAGVLKDKSDPASVIETINETNFLALQQEQVISDGMIPKLENAFSAIRYGVQKVVIGHADQLQELINGTKGTTVL